MEKLQFFFYFKLAYRLLNELKYEKERGKQQQFNM